MQPWPVRPIRRVMAALLDAPVQTDAFGRLVRYPGKTEIACPAQTPRTAVLVVAGQSNAGNFQGQGYDAVSDHVVNFSGGRCYRATSPLLGADGKLGETWTLLGNKLLAAGLFETVVLIPVAAGSSPIARWEAGGDLNGALAAAIRAAKMRYTITGLLWDQGAEDFMRHTPPERFRAALGSLIGTVRGLGVRAPFFITRCSYGDVGWSEDNPIARAEAAMADAAGQVYDGPNTDHDMVRTDRFDGAHFAASGQEKYTDAWVRLLRAHPGV
jgi:hypothetical protein